MKLWATMDMEGVDLRRTVDLWSEKPINILGGGGRLWVSKEPPHYGSSVSVAATIFFQDYGCLPHCNRPMRVELIGKVPQ